MRWPSEIAEQVWFDVRFALTFKVSRKLRPLTDAERDRVAREIVEHLQLANWEIQRGAPSVGAAGPARPAAKSKV